MRYGIPRKAVPAYVVFQRALPQQWRWWHLITGREWAHCWMMRAEAVGEPGLLGEWITIKVETTPARVHIDVYGGHPDNLVAEAQVAMRTIDVLALTIDIGGREEYCPRGPMSCVSLVKAMLGVWWPTVITPRQLHRKLVSLGAASARVQWQTR